VLANLLPPHLLLVEIPGDGDRVFLAIMIRIPGKMIIDSGMIVFS
jgi:hypothetical protein